MREGADVAGRGAASDEPAGAHFVQRACAGGVHGLTLNRPEKKNALSHGMYAALSDGLKCAEADDDVAVHLIKGVPGVFTAGNDLRDFAALANEEDLEAAFCEVLAFVRVLPRLEKPLLAAVDGPAIGIGTTLLFHCDLVFATPRARFSTPFVDLGLVPEAAAGLLGPKRLGHARAFELLVLGREVDAAWMHAAGLVNAVVADTALDAYVEDVALCLARKPRSAMLAAHDLMRSDRDQVMAQTEAEIAVFFERLRSPEARAAFDAFLREPGA